MDNNSTFNSSSNSTNGTSDGFQFNAAPKPFWTNLLLPIIYLTILIGSLYTFSHVYRQRKITKAARLENWFPPHRQRDIYLSLLHLDPQDASEGEKKLSKVPDSVLKAALLRRAVEDIQRIVVLRSSKPPLQNLLQRGSVGDELWQRFLRAEKEMEEEVKDVVNEVGCIIACLSTRAALTYLGECIRTQLGPNHLPVCERNQPEPSHQGAHRRAAVTDRDRKGLVGQEARRHLVRLHEGAGRRARRQQICRCRDRGG